MQRLYEETVKPITTVRTKGAWFGGWRLVSLDGGTFDVPDDPALEAALYHARREIETVPGELKTHLRGSKIVLRSKTPDLVRQEIYGLLLAHFAIRGLMHEAALKADEDPDRLSFIHAVRVMRGKIAAFGCVPPRQRPAPHRAILEEILQERLPPRDHRRNKRGVKRAMSNDPVGRKADRASPPTNVAQCIQIVI